MSRVQPRPVPETRYCPSCGQHTTFSGGACGGCGHACHDDCDHPAVTP